MKREKLALALDELAVESFDTTPELEDGRGTVRAHETEPQPTPPQEEPDCTCYKTCLCRTAYYHCGTGPHTIHSCDYTQNNSCRYDTVTTCTA